ncbi:MAG: ATP synthase F1 subunit epsilon [Saccharofermentans sp.]|jgi:F-type H+-transporting ATPase subunit epsilon|nr:ATP synthase F1 subunit epsilon [Mageeibacillus sp.]MCI1263649.1 ATP synthase F1 subunit epsilon [Saccharofermentans sp.]MCI1274726.1 ATP synthase F1 subunit epsilon [Saccharofermentans sp.]MCI1769340.1 ATP synthase F1 subunit epsilon [Mageeibacillus sp.]MCI2043661.1 ATP synthase F1 subunit epsilon [Mageeibacillus sp.]
MAESISKKINLIVVTPYQNFYEGAVTVATIPSVDGEIGIMAEHSPLVVALKPGIVTIRIDDEIKHFVVSEGYSEINQRMILVVCNSAEWAENIHVRWIFQAIAEAEKALAEQKNDEAGQLYTEDNRHKLSRSLARRHFIELYGSESQKQRLEQLSQTPYEI